MVDKTVLELQWHRVSKHRSIGQKSLTRVDTVPFQRDGESQD